MYLAKVMIRIKPYILVDIRFFILKSPQKHLNYYIKLNIAEYLYKSEDIILLLQSGV